MWSGRQVILMPSDIRGRNSHRQISECRLLCDFKKRKEYYSEIKPKDKSVRRNSHGKQSTRENKTIYQLCREAAGLTRAEASEKMDAVSASKIKNLNMKPKNLRLMISSRWQMPIKDQIFAIITALVSPAASRQSW